jgi:transposase
MGEARVKVRERVRAGYVERGELVRELAEAVGWSIGTVYNLLREAGVSTARQKTPPSTGPARVRERELVRAAYVDRGLTVRAIQAETGIGYGKIHTLLKEAGVVMRQHGGRHGQPESTQPWAVARRRREAAARAEAPAAAA